MLQRIVLGLLLLTATAHAQDTTAEARVRMTEGNAAVKRGDFDAAVLAYRAAYAIKQHAVVLQNLGMAEVHAGQFVEGARHLTTLLAGSEAVSDRKFVEKMLTKAENEVVRIEITVNVPGAEVSVDKQVVGRSPLSTPWHVAPGEYRVQARLDGYVAATKSVTGAAGKSVTVDLVLHKVEQTVPAAGSGPGGTKGAGAAAGGTTGGGDAASNEGPSLVPIYVTGGVAAVGLTAALVFELSRSSHADDAARLVDNLGPGGCANGSPSSAACAELHDANAAKNRNADRRNVSLGVAGAAVLFGVAYLVWPRSTAKSESTTLMLVPAVSPSRSGMSLSGSFW